METQWETLSPQMLRAPRTSMAMKRLPTLFATFLTHGKRIGSHA